jgi:hypothetical protein
MNERQDMLGKVKKVKIYFSAKGVTRDEFIDNVYGLMNHKEYNRVLNLWGCKTVEKEFTEKMEKYAMTRDRVIEDMEVFKRFNEFVEWYTLRCGAEPLTTLQIENVYERFIIKKEE